MVTLHCIKTAGSLSKQHCADSAKNDMTLILNILMAVIVQISDYIHYNEFVLCINIMDYTEWAENGQTYFSYQYLRVVLFKCWYLYLNAVRYSFSCLICIHYLMIMSYRWYISNEYLAKSHRNTLAPQHINSPNNKKLE